MHTTFTHEAAYETLIQRFEHQVFNLVSRLIDDPSDAACVTTKVFRKIFRGVGTFHGEGPLKNWIYRIAVREAQTGRWLPRSQRRAVQSDSIEDALRRINPKFRTALVLREIEGLAYREISAILEVSPETVKSRIDRGRDALGKHLQHLINPSLTPGWSAQLAD